MAKDEVKRSENDATDEQTRPARGYMNTWGSTVQNKQSYADEHKDDATVTEEDAVKVEAARPGVNPVVSPQIGADGKPLAQ